MDLLGSGPAWSELSRDPPASRMSGCREDSSGWEGVGPSRENLKDLEMILERNLWVESVRFGQRQQQWDVSKCWWIL